MTGLGGYKVTKDKVIYPYITAMSLDIIMY